MYMSDVMWIRSNGGFDVMILYLVSKRGDVCRDTVGCVFGVKQFRLVITHSICTMYGTLTLPYPAQDIRLCL